MQIKRDTKEFDNWKRKVDAVLERTLGVSTGDLADACYYDMYEDGYTPTQAARQVVRENF